MKAMKKLVNLLLTLSIALALAMPAMAGSGEGVSAASADYPDTADCTITIEMPYDIDLSVKNTYTLTRIFGATVIETDGAETHISYKLLDPSYLLPKGFIKLAGDYVGLEHPNDPLEMSSLEEYVDYLKEQHAPDIYTVIVQNGAVTGVQGAAITTEDLNDGTGAKITKVTVPVKSGFYYISTTTGSAVMVDSTNPNAKVEDKNSVPAVTKVITDAQYEGDDKDTIVEVGDQVYFSVTITVGKGAINYVLHDIMSDGLSYNGDLEIFVDGESVEPGEDTWELAEPPEPGDTLTVVFHKNYPEKTVITAHYSAAVISSQLYGDTGTNTVYVSYGSDEGGNKTAEDTVKVYNAKVTVSKVDGRNAPLSGAGFVLRNDNPGDFEGKYYTLHPADESHPKGPYIDWVADMEDAVLYVQSMTVNGQEVSGVEFSGLNAGVYTLIESKVPDGYNKADDKTFTVNKENIVYFDDKMKETEAPGRSLVLTIVNNAGTELPDTGGIGTTIFTVAGGALMLGAAVLFVAKKRSGGN